MKELREDRGGYALLYVLIIVAVLCAIAAVICTAALQNFQAQARSVAQTRQLYQAEGEIEKFVALAGDVSRLETHSSGEYMDKETAKEEAVRLCKDGYQAKLDAYKAELDNENGSCGLDIDTTSGTDACKFTLTYQNGYVQIETTVSMALKYGCGFREQRDDSGDGDSVICEAKVSEATPTYLTYTITHLTAERGEGDETE